MWDSISSNLEPDYTITSLDDSVDVPAGYFPRCLRIDAVGFLALPSCLMPGIRIIKVEQTQWYAPRERSPQSARFTANQISGIIPL